MKGLLYKDWLLIRKTKLRILLLVIVVHIILYIKYGDITLMSIISILGLFSMLATITYDDNDNGMSMLLTLPYTRQDYVQSKYLSSILVLILLLVFEVCLTSIVDYFQNPQTFDFTDNLLTILMILAVISILFWIVLPVQLKFGSEGTLLIIFSLLILCMVGFILFLFNENIILTNAYKILKIFFSNKWNRLITSILAMGITYIASLNISMRIMQRREY